jgi:hypothetical protein
MDWYRGRRDATDAALMATISRVARASRSCADSIAAR